MPRILAFSQPFGARAKDIGLYLVLWHLTRDEAIKVWQFTPGTTDAAPQGIDDALRADPEYAIGKRRLDGLADVSAWVYGQVLDGKLGPAPAWLAEAEGNPSSGEIIFLREDQIAWLRERAVQITERA